MILIAPGFTPPTVDPIGKFNPPPSPADKVTPPKSNVAAAKYAVFQRLVGEPKLYVTCALGKILPK